VKRSTIFILAILLICTALFVRGHILKKEIRELREHVMAEELHRIEGDDRVQKHLDTILEDLLRQVGSMDQEIREMTGRHDLEKLLPVDYVERVRGFIADQIDELVDQQPVFGAVWEILSIRFFSPDIIAVQCRDGEIQGTLLVLIYSEDKETYIGEVLYSNIKPWAG
jgi:hypothetical protein